MANYQLLKADIDAKVYQNGKQEITGENLNSVLNAMVTTLGAGYQFIGVATPTNPGATQTPDYKCFYLATTPGTYTNLGGLVVADGEVAILKYDTSWTKEVTGAATADQVSQLGQDITANEGRIINQFSRKIEFSVSGGYYNNSFIYTEDERAKNTGILPLKGINMLSISTTFSTSFKSVFFLDINKTPISSLSKSGDFNGTIDTTGSDYNDAYYFVVQHYGTGSIPSVFAYCNDEKYNLASSINYGIDYDVILSEIGYLRYSNKVIDTDGNARNTGYIYIGNYKKLYYRTTISNVGYSVAFFDSAFSLLTDISIRGNNDVQENIIDLSLQQYRNACYVLISAYSSAHIFNPYSCILYNDDSLNVRAFKKDKNTQLIKLSETGYINSEGTLIEDSNAKWSGYIPIQEDFASFDCKLNISNSGYAIAFFDDSMSIMSSISLVGNRTLQNYTFQEGAKYIAASTYGTSLAFFSINKKEYYALNKTNEQDCLVPSRDEPLNIINQYPGFAALFTEWGVVGDSLSSGCLEVKTPDEQSYHNVDFIEFSWPQYLGRLTGSDVTNFSTGGRTAATWLSGNTERDWAGAKTNPKRNYIIALGVNDSETVGTLNDIGTYDPSTDTDTNGNTFIGHYAGIIQRLRSVSPKSKIFVVTIPKRYSDGKQAYSKAIRSITNVFDNVFVIDLFTYSKNNDYWNYMYRSGFHLQTVGYLYSAYEIMSYIDWIVRNNTLSFKDEALIGTEYISK